jgi:hypothetical protein
MYELAPGERLNISGLPIDATGKGAERLQLINDVGATLLPALETIEYELNSQWQSFTFGRSDEHKDGDIRLLDGREWYVFIVTDIGGAKHDEVSKRIADLIRPYSQKIREKFSLQLLEMSFSKP